MDDYGPDIITISDEDGVEYELEVLARLEFEGTDYLALAWNSRAPIIWP